MPKSTSPYAWDHEYDWRPIWRIKPADRPAELARQIHHATCNGDIEDDPETGQPIIEITWLTSKFDSELQVEQFAFHGISNPRTGNGKPAVIVSSRGDYSVELHHIETHMIGRVEPVKEA